MSQLLSNRFTQFSHSSLEQLEGVNFTQLQREVIQNLISEAALEKVALLFNSNNPLQFAQQEAELQGKIEILEYLLLQFESISQLVVNNNFNSEQ